MAENLAQALDFKSNLSTAGSKGVAEGMKVNILQPTRPHIPLQSVLQGSRIHEVVCAGQDKDAGIFWAHPFTQPEGILC